MTALSAAVFISAATAPMASADTGAEAVATGAAPAVSTPLVCTADTGTQAAGSEYEVQAYETYVPGDQRVYGEAGGVLNFDVGEQTTASVTVDGSTTAEAGAVFAKASLTLGISVGASSSVTTNQGYTWTVPADQPLGWIEVGRMGYQLDWQRGHYNSPCTWVQEASGSTLSVSDMIAFSHS